MCKGIKKVIDEPAEMETIAIDYLGEGEPTIDENFVLTPDSAGHLTKQLTIIFINVIITMQKVCQ
jgi:hypothetical protein